jgi:hypothetical protein
MTNTYTILSPVRALRVAALLGLAMGYGPLARATAVPAASVARIESTPTADLVLLNRGSDGGFRQGMVCRITRGTTEIAEVLLVELRPTCSAALILSVTARQSIRAGDVAAIKILKT